MIQTFLARLFLILSLPFWFPRLLFSFLYEFCALHLGSLRAAEMAESLPPTTRDHLLVLSGGQSADSELIPPEPQRRSHLRLIAGGLHQPAIVEPEAVSAPAGMGKIVR